MHVALNATYRLQGGGLTHLRRLLAAWSADDVRQANQVTVLVRHSNLVLLRDVLGDWAQVNVVDVEHPFNAPGKLLWEQIVLPRLLRRTGADVLFCPGNMVPLRSPVPSVVLFQNAGPFCASMGPTSMGAYAWLWFRALGAMMRRSARAAHQSIFVSRYLRDLFVERFGLPPSRTEVIYHGTGPDGAAGEAKGPASSTRAAAFAGPYILFLSHLYPYKRVEDLILAVGLARDELAALGLKLVIAGEPRGAGYYAGLLRLVRKQKLDSLVLFAGGLSHEDALAAIRHCHFFVFQSTCENCPISLIEALEAGVPICSSNAGVMPEIAGAGALYFNPIDPASIAHCLSQLARDAALRQRLAAQARQEAARFPTWREVGLRTLATLERAATT